MGPDCLGLLEENSCQILGIKSICANQSIVSESARLVLAQICSGVPMQYEKPTHVLSLFSIQAFQS